MYGFTVPVAVARGAGVLVAIGSKGIGEDCVTVFVGVGLLTS
jgi:hypothetical protein